MKERYFLRVYGPPRIPDEEHAREREAIDSGRRHLLSRTHGFAEVRDQKTSSRVVWDAYVTQAGTLKEDHPREPGSDDA